MQQRFPISVLILALLYLVVGIGLFKAIPIFGDLYNSMYGDWNSSKNSYLPLFNLPQLLWLLLGLGVSLNVILVNIFAKNPTFKKRCNITMMLLWIIFVIHAVDILYGFMFCHEWGCSRMLPTWHWFGL